MMKAQPKKPIYLLAILILMFTGMMWLALSSVHASPPGASQAQTAALVVSGSYAGTVVVNEPVTLRMLTLSINITQTEGALVGKVITPQTQVFLGEPALSGGITASAGVTPTFRLDSERFTDAVSGRMIGRQFSLVGEVLQNGDKLYGEYVETITGFTPKPLQIKGTFLVTRPAGTTRVIVQPDTPSMPTATSTPTATWTPTATATPTATPTAPVVIPPDAPSGGNGSLIYLPLIDR